MHKILQEVPARIREFREALELPAAELAKLCGLTPEEYARYESGEADIPISVLFEIAVHLHTDMTVLLTGEDPRMDSVCVVRKGKGLQVDRLPGYRYASLAYNFKNRIMEPLFVEITPEDDSAALFSHGGQEFNYVTEGCVRVTVKNRDYILSAGDSIYFDPVLPHAQKAVGGPAKFVTVILE